MYTVDIRIARPVKKKEKSLLKRIFKLFKSFDP